MVTNDFIRDLTRTIGDCLDNHIDDLLEDTDIQGGYELWTQIMEGAVLAANRYLTRRRVDGKH